MELRNMMVDSNQLQVDLDNPMDISIPLRSGSKNPNCYHAESPIFKPVVQDGFIGSIAQGGPCNHRIISIVPHGNGTHTECYGHISPSPQATLNNSLKKFHFLAQLISVEPHMTDQDDQVILWDHVQKKLGDQSPEALVIRTLPNSADKLTRQYSGTNPPYLEPGFGGQLAARKISHLLTDLPSIDKEVDGGKLINHHEFWGYPENPRTDCTITELIFVPDSILDGIYLLNLQICSLESDASPSKPILYHILSR